jgi:hypothetical protein
MQMLTCTREYIVLIKHALYLLLATVLHLLLHDGLSRSKRSLQPSRQKIQFQNQIFLHF